MTPWLLFGAGGKGVGARTLELALAEQRPVVAVIRHADAATKLAQQGVQVFTGDACDASVVAAACRAAGPDALIISTMGGAQDYLAHRTVIDEAEKAGISRMILVTSLGCGDSWPFPVCNAFVRVSKHEQFPPARKTPAPNRNNNVAGLRGLSWLTILLIARFLPGYLPLL